MAYLNSLPRQYIQEGVYRSHVKQQSTDIQKDKFGNVLYKSIENGVTDYEVAFTGDKIVILNPTADIKEVIGFTNDIKITYISENATSYAFPIANWQIRSQDKDLLISDILPTIKDDDSLSKPYRLRVILSIEKEERPVFNLWYCFRIPEYDGSQVKSNNPFDSYCLPLLWLDDLIYAYSDAFGPSYPSSSRYEDYEYDLTTYQR